MAKRVNYRKIAFSIYDAICAHCGFGISAVLEVAHIDGNRSNNDPVNLVILCPTCHKMHDIDLISTEAILAMRDRKAVAKWSKRMKDAGAKAAATRARRSKSRKIAGEKAAMTRKRRAAAKKAVATRRSRGTT